MANSVFYQSRRERVTQAGPRRLNTDFAAEWQDRYYAVKQVAPIIVEEDGETVVVTVYTFYF